jgi:hypothetical protein
MPNGRQTNPWAGITEVLAKTGGIRSEENRKAIVRLLGSNRRDFKAQCGTEILDDRRICSKFLFIRSTFHPFNCKRINIPITARAISPAAYVYYFDVLSSMNRDWRILRKHGMKEAS